MVLPRRGEIPGSCPDAVRYHALFRDQRKVEVGFGGSCLAPPGFATVGGTPTEQSAAFQTE